MDKHIVSCELLNEIILDNITDGVFTIDHDFNITSFNKSGCRITGYQCDEVVGKKCFDVFKSNICEHDCAMRKAMQTGKKTINKTVYIINKFGYRIPVSISTAPLIDRDGDVLGGVETFRDLSAEDELRKVITKNYSYHDIISKNAAMWRLFEILPQIAESKSTVLLEGESGTGKELFARVIHQLSPRADKSFIAVNCGALPDTLLESELFGYKAGAFTDAKRDKLGRIALAEGGTLFLDEIGDISPAFQIRLLRFLQERTYEPLGAVETHKADVRIIAASNKNLAQLVEQGRFRKDLFYRINIIRLEIPPLRKRKEDIPLLIQHFIKKFNHIQGKEIQGVSSDVLEILMHHNYPGNVRELENIVEHSFVLCSEPLIQRKHLPVNLFEPAKNELHQTYHRKLEDVEAELIIKTLRDHNWNRQSAAKALNMHKTTLFRKIKRLGIELPQIDGRHKVNKHS
ncbi:Fis family transcriptional regulator [candidate division KSB1 bacterium]|nr:MAG: Fis family transcriptional regulator [candidate division KSB1 bacterium]